MFKGNRNLAVGLFFTLALIGILLFALWLAGTKGTQKMERYTLLFERDVSGLSLGGPVYYLGVNVGRVTNMKLIPGAQIRVQVDIDVLADTPINAGTYGSLMAQGITGVSVINIAGEPGDHGPLPKPEGYDNPLIPVRQTGLSALLSDAPLTMYKLNNALDQLNLLLGEENRDAIAGLLKNLEALITALAEERESFAALPDDFRGLINQAGLAIDDVRTLVTEVKPGLTRTLENTSTASANLAKLSASLDKLLADNEAEFQHFIDNGLGKTPELVHDLRSTLRELQKLLHQLQDDPSQLIHRSPDSALEVKP